ncbi:MAG: AAA family ATPase, partial [bacterium]|nr:AAA family ATPase [bacterium]
FFYVSTQINEENRHAIANSDYLLCDRSVLDQWIYWKSHYTDLEMSPQLQEKNDILRKLYQFWIKTYDLVFFIRMDLNELENREFNSEFRTADKEYIKKMEELFIETIKEDNLKVIEIWNNTTVDEGAHAILKAITEHKASLETSEPSESTEAPPLS